MCHWPLLLPPFAVTTFCCYQPLMLLAAAFMNLLSLSAELSHLSTLASLIYRHGLHFVACAYCTVLLDGLAVASAHNATGAVLAMAKIWSGLLCTLANNMLP